MNQRGFASLLAVFFPFWIVPVLMVIFIVDILTDIPLNADVVSDLIFIIWACCVAWFMIEICLEFSEPRQQRKMPSNPISSHNPTTRDDYVKTNHQFAHELECALNKWASLHNYELPKYVIQSWYYRAMQELALHLLKERHPKHGFNHKPQRWIIDMTDRVNQRFANVIELLQLHPSFST